MPQHFRSGDFGGLRTGQIWPWRAFSESTCLIERLGQHALLRRHLRLMSRMRTFVIKVLGTNAFQGEPTGIWGGGVL